MYIFTHPGYATTKCAKHDACVTFEAFMQLTQAMVSTFLNELLHMLSAFCMSNFLVFINIQLQLTQPAWANQHQETFECMVVYEVQNPPLCAIKQQHLHPSFLFILLVFFFKHENKTGGKRLYVQRSNSSSSSSPYYSPHRAQTAFNGSCKTQKHAQCCGHSTSQRAKHCPDVA